MVRQLAVQTCRRLMLAQLVKVPNATNREPIFPRNGRREQIENSNKVEVGRSYIIPAGLLQLDHPPPSRLRVIDILRRPRHPNRIRDQLNSIFHASR
jgi:hypothetical protein